MRGAGPSPVVPPVAATGRPAEKLMTDAPSSTATTAAATARSGPRRPTKDRRRGSDRSADRHARLALRDETRRRDDRVQAAPDGVSDGRPGRSRRPCAREAMVLWSGQASEDALESDRCVQQYGLHGVGRSSGAWGRGGWGAGGGPSRGRGFELGSLFASDARVCGLTTSRATLPRTLQRGQTGVAVRAVRRRGSSSARTGTRRSTASWPDG